MAFNVLEVADARLRRLPTLLTDERIGGLITLGALPPPVIDELARALAVPLVMVDNWAAELSWDSVMMDNAGGVTLAVEHLIAQGHREIVFVAGPPHPSIVERQHGYTATMQRHGLRTHVLTTPDLGLADGEAAANTLIETRSTATAVACANDMLAIGLIRRLVQQGVRVPAQVAVTGFDDIELASFTQPALTTVTVDRVAFGRLAVELLLGRVNSPARPPVRCTLGVRLAMRESTASTIHSIEKDN